MRFLGGLGGRRSGEPEALGRVDSTAADFHAERRQLLLRFESLGENCELGFLQQHFSVDPLGLFRWSGISVDSLRLALESGLAGIGEPEFTGIDKGGPSAEYSVFDTRYGMRTHTHVLGHQDSEENVLKTFCTRARRLREKLLEDLQEGRKIFLLQTSGPVAEADLSPLHTAFRRLGPAAEMLHVRPAVTEAPGSVERQRPGLLRAFIDKAGFDGERWAISYDLWLEIMRGAVAIVDGGG